MESITLHSRTGLLASEVRAFAVGAVKKPTKKHTDENPSYYYQLHLAHSDDAGDAVYVFCEAEHAEQVAAAIRNAGSAVEVLVDLRITRRGLNVEAVKVEG